MWKKEGVWLQLAGAAGRHTKVQRERCMSVWRRPGGPIHPSKLAPSQAGGSTSLRDSGLFVPLSFLSNVLSDISRHTSATFIFTFEVRP